MSWRLRSHSNFPPGSFQYEQTVGIQKRWGGQGLEELVPKVLNFRVGNKLPRASKAEVLQDIDEFNAERLGHNPQWTYNTDAPFTASQLAAVGAAGCPGCGATLT
jgi:hypothetical protein